MVDAIAHAQYIDFSKGWAQGLCELLALLTELHIPRASGAVRAGLWQGVQLNRGFFSFTLLHQLQHYFGPDLPLECVAERATDAFLDAGWPDLHLAARDACPKFTDLARQSFDGFFPAKG